MENKEDNVEKKQEPKLPIFYEQVRGLMNLMVKYHTLGEGDKYLRDLKMLYSRIRPDLKKDQQECFDDKILELQKDYYKKVKGTNKYGYPDGSLVGEKKAFCNIIYNVEVELFEAMEEAGVFKILKQNPEDFELGGG